jgi:hypothetical protein
MCETIPASKVHPQVRTSPAYFREACVSQIQEAVPHHAHSGQGRVREAGESEGGEPIQQLLGPSPLHMMQTAAGDLAEISIKSISSVYRTHIFSPTDG